MRRWLVPLSVVMFSAPVAAQAPAPASTLEGVYSREQALRGADLYLGYCRSCHTPESHNSETFIATWTGKPLAELFEYIRERMPKNDPGILTRQEVADVVAYVLRLNGLPQGTDELPADSTSLARIRFRVAPPAPKTPD